LAFSFSLFNPGFRYTDRDGVFVFFATLIISRKRGTPRVTFLALTPASRMQNLRVDMTKIKLVPGINYIFAFNTYCWEKQNFMCK
jgi:hypothetical protein